MNPYTLPWHQSQLPDGGGRYHDGAVRVDHSVDIR